VTGCAAKRSGSWAHELTALHGALPSLEWLEITDRKAGAVKLTRSTRYASHGTCES
jgi:hypothetical protein